MNVDRGWFLSVLALIGLGLLLLLASVWLSIERTNLSYGIEKLEKDIHAQKKLLAKLEVERDNLLSPHQLERLARRHGLGPARPGQLRRMDGASRDVKPGRTPSVFDEPMADAQQEAEEQ